VILATAIRRSRLERDGGEGLGRKAGEQPTPNAIERKGVNRVVSVGRF
jgi:hypothetical protein